MSLIKSLGYTIFFGKNSLAKLQHFVSSNNYSAYFILCDENTLQNCLPVLISHCPALAQANIIEVESGEDSKSIEICTQIWHTLAENTADRNSLLINLGGGVVSDLGGFCASVYKRGIDFIHIPTSLLAMADASVGGKTGIDFSGYKNMIGTFTQPKAVFIFPDFLLTLPKHHINNGLAEIYKIALVADNTLWIQLSSPGGLKKPEQVIKKSVELKNNIVLKDPYDKTVRKILNFGHSIGHAIESHFLGTPHELLHGEAVFAGMMVECHLAWQKKLIGKLEMLAICEILHQQFRGPVLPLEPILNLLRNDKKNKNNTLKFALINGIGSCIYDIEVSNKQVATAIDFYNILQT